MVKRLDFFNILNKSIAILKSDLYFFLRISFLFFVLPQFLFLILKGKLFFIGFNIIYLFYSFFAITWLFRFLVKKRMPDFKEYLSYLWISVRVSLLIFLWSLLFIIPGIIKYVQYKFAVFLAVTKNTSFKESLKLSKKVVKGRAWTVFFYFLFFDILLLLISGIGTSLLSLIGNGLVFVFNIIFIWITFPLSVIFIKVFYTELKKKH